MRQHLSRAFYGPPDWIALHTTARTRRAINFWLLVLWLGPGLALWIALRNVFWFLGFMSIYAIWAGHLGAASAETPVENE